MPADGREPGAGSSAVWDLPVRLFHWSLVGLVVAAYVTGNEERYYSLHKGAGIAILALLLFRILWGFFGTQPARFPAFVKGPRAVVSHIGDLIAHRHRPAPTHNPLGGWGVLALLSLLLAEVATGLTSSTFDYEGPLAALLPDSWSSAMATLHLVIFDLLAATILAHLVGVAVTSWAGRENLLGSMITGRKRLEGGRAAADLATPWQRAFWSALAAGLLTWALLSLPKILP